MSLWFLGEKSAIFCFSSGNKVPGWYVCQPKEWYGCCKFLFQFFNIDKDHSSVCYRSDIYSFLHAYLALAKLRKFWMCWIVCRLQTVEIYRGFFSRNCDPVVFPIDPRSNGRCFVGPIQRRKQFHSRGSRKIAESDGGEYHRSKISELSYFVGI